MRRKTPIARLVDADLLQEFISYQRWAGDDFSIYLLSDSDRRWGEKMELEILRRMGTRADVGGSQEP